MAGHKYCNGVSISAQLLHLVRGQRFIHPETNHLCGLTGDAGVDFTRAARSTCGRAERLTLWKTPLFCRGMTAATALEKQIERYRLMTGEQRLAVALDLHELSCDIAREGIRRKHPDADATEVERLLRHRLELARAA